MSVRLRESDRQIVSAVLDVKVSAGGKEALGEADVAE